MMQCTELGGMFWKNTHSLSVLSKQYETLHQKQDSAASKNLGCIENEVLH